MGGKEVIFLNFAHQSNTGNNKRSRVFAGCLICTVILHAN